MNGDTLIYDIEGNPRRSVSPDCYVALDLSANALESIERNNVYLLSEVGKASDFIPEIGSHSRSRADLGRKRDLYAEVGVSDTDRRMRQRHLVEDTSLFKACGPVWHQKQLSAQSPDNVRPSL